MEEILSHFMFRMMPHVGAQIRMRNSKHLRSRYATVSSELKMDPAGIYLDTYDLHSSRNDETPETQTGPLLFSRPRKRFSADPSVKRMDKTFTQRF